MAKLVIGNNKQVATGAIVRDVGPAYYIEQILDNGVLKGSTHIPDFTGVTNFSKGLFFETWNGNKGAYIYGNLDLRSLTEITGGSGCFSSAFVYQTQITSLDFSNVFSIEGSQMCANMFKGCSRLASVNMSSLDHIYDAALQNIFQDCPVVDIDLSRFREIRGGSGTIYPMSSAFSGNTAITNISFQSLRLLYPTNALEAAFNGARNLRDIYFPALTESSFGPSKTQLKNLVRSVTGCTIHFPKNLDPENGGVVLPTLNGYPLFSGTNTVLAFDLPSTNHLIGANTVEYERSPKYDTVTALAWRVNDTIVESATYYTSGLIDPTVGTTIYSDAACTTAVTTISSIA